VGVFLHVTNLRHVLSKFQFDVNTLYTILNENSRAKLVSVQNVEAIFSKLWHYSVVSKSKKINRKCMGILHACRDSIPCMQIPLYFLIKSGFKNSATLILTCSFHFWYSWSMLTSNLKSIRKS
jgi:hypothetical protein